MSPQRMDLLDLLAAEHAARTVDELARLSDLHPNTVRNHLDGLVLDGVVERSSERSGQRGRPSWRYRVIPERMAGAPEYVGLAMALAEKLAHISPDPASVARAAGESWAARIPGDSNSQADVLTLLQDLGFEPTREEADIRLTQCPLLSAARENPEVVCGVHDGLIRARLGDDEQGWLEPFAGPGYCMWHGSSRDSDRVGRGAPRSTSVTEQQSV